MLLVDMLYFIAIFFFYFHFCLEFDTVRTWQARKSWNVPEKSEERSTGD